MIENRSLVPPPSELKLPDVKGAHLEAVTLNGQCNIVQIPTFFWWENSLVTNSLPIILSKLTADIHSRSRRLANVLPP